MANKSKFRLYRIKSRSGMFMVAPSIIILGVFVIYPIISSLILSLFKWDLLSNERLFIGLANYGHAFGDERFWNALKNTVLFTVGFVPGCVILALILAVFLNTRIRGHNLFQSIFFLPAISSMAIVALAWRFLLDGDVGLASYWFRSLGMVVTDPLRDPDSALLTIILVSIWRWAGFNMVILLAGLNTIPNQYYEAAEIDGAGSFLRLFKITLPLLLPSLSFVIITSIIGSFQVFDQIYVMTKGGPMFRTEVMVYYTYYQGFYCHQ